MLCVRPTCRRVPDSVVRGSSERIPRRRPDSERKVDASTETVRIFSSTRQFDIREPTEAARRRLALHDDDHTHAVTSSENTRSKHKAL